MALLLTPVLLLLTALPAFANEEVYYFHNDHLGTPQALSDQSGKIVWTAEYRPFGEAVVNEDPDGDGQRVECNLRFPGQYYDAETGLHYNYMRDYDPGTGRYAEADPAGIGTGTNQIYAYAQDDPLIFIDPLGLLSCKQIKELVKVNNDSGQSDNMIVCMCWKESRFDPSQQNASSGARGLMGILKSTAKWNGFKYEDLFDPKLNIQAGTAILKAHIRIQKGNVRNGLIHYGDQTAGYAESILKCERCFNEQAVNDCPTPNNEEKDCKKCLYLIGN